MLTTVTGSRVPHPGYYDYSATGPQATDTQSQQLYYGNGAAGDHNSRPGSSQGGSVYPQPHRSSTPDHSAPRPDRGMDCLSFLHFCQFNHVPYQP